MTEMTAYEHILARQTAWAANRGIKLIGSRTSHGRPAYTPTLDQNLFEPLLPEVRASFQAGDGSELGSPPYPGKMQAVHSSSALGVNIFQYWKRIAVVPEIAAACGLCRQGSQVSLDIRFEERYPIRDDFARHPNIDVVIHNKPSARIRVFAVECKFTEAYGGRIHGGIKEKYPRHDDIWGGLPHLREFAEKISPEDREFRHLHPAQLVKHILGLNRHPGRHGFRLLYLWYDALGEQGSRHREEIARFSRIAKKDGIRFHALSYQELIGRLMDRYRNDHRDYIRYLTERYL